MYSPDEPIQITTPYADSLSSVNISFAEAPSPDDPRQVVLRVWERANQISRINQLEDYIEQMVQLLIEVTKGETGIFYLLDQETKELIFALIKASQNPPDLFGLRVKQDQGIVGAAVKSRQNIMVHDLATDKRWLHALDPDLSSRWHNVATFPLISENKPIGAVQIYNFQELDLPLVEVLIGRLVTDIKKLEALERAKYSNQRLTSLISVIGQVAGTLERDTILRYITENAARLLGAERTSIFLVDPETHNTVQNISYQADPNARPSSKPSFHEILQKTHPSEKTKPRAQLFSQSTKTYKTHGKFGFISPSTITVPLQSGLMSLSQQNQEGRLLGGLMALNKQDSYFTDEDAQLLTTLAEQASTLLQVAELHQEANELFIDVIKALVSAIDAKDPYTQGHSIRVSELSISIAEELGASQDFIKDLLIGSLLHDVGKIGIPDQILLKPGRLTNDEYAIIKRHPAIGSAIMGEVRLLKAAIPAIEQHHERLDGTGYPNHLTSEQISMMGRIVGVADVFDAMTSDRPYRSGMSFYTVLKYLLDQSGKHFDPDCVQALSRVKQREQMGKYLSV